MDSEEEEEEDEDLERASDTLLGRDLVRECLEKDPADRNDDDIGQFNSSLTLLLSVFGETLVLFLARLHVRRRICCVGLRTKETRPSYSRRLHAG